MSEHAEPRPAWSVPVAVKDIPDEGRRVELAANEATRKAVAAAIGISGLPRLEASFDLTRRGEGVHVVGQVSATVGQTCVVTLDPVENEVQEAVDLLFLPESEALAATRAKPALSHDVDDEEPPEVLRHGMVDLGEVALEFLALGVDPYPRKPGATFEVGTTADEPASHPFAALEALKRRGGA